MASAAALWGTVLFWPCGLVAATADARPLRVLILADAGYQARHSDWRGRTGEIVAEASRALAPLVGRRLEVSEWLPWPQPARLVRGDQAARWLARVRPAGADLVAGFTAARLPAAGGNGRLELGNASAFGRQLLVADWGDDVHVAARVLVHEVLHVFGAFHVPDPSSIMQPQAESVPEAWELGTVPKAVLARTRGFDPARGIESVQAEDLAEVSRLYRAHHHPAERAGADPVALGYAYQAAARLRKRDLQGAEVLARRACELAPECGEAWRQLGEVLLVDERRVEAEQSLERAVACGDGGVSARLLLAEVQWGLGKAAAAEKLAAEALEMEPESAAAHRLAGLCAHVAGDAARYDKERRWLEKQSPRAAVVLARRAQQMPAARYRALAENWEAARGQMVVTNSVGMEFVALEAHDRRAASIGGERAQPTGGAMKMFWIGRTEVTQGQYVSVMGANPSRFARRGEGHPVEQVSWSEAANFCQKLSAREDERRAGARYRLPTEAEWVAACGGDDQAGDSRRWLADYAWVTDGTHRVATKGPNARGLFDMLGNVAEWCAGEVPLAETNGLDRGGSRREGRGHVARGGSSDDPSGPPRLSSRQFEPPGLRSWRIGFRVVREMADRP